MTTLRERLEQILPRVTDASFLASTGIGNEIACYIFDYPANEELAVRNHITLLLDQIERHHPTIQALHLDLLDVSTAYLTQRQLMEKALDMEQRNGEAHLLRALRSPLAAEKVAEFIAEEYRPASQDLVLMSGVGSVWPILRAHSLLNCMHSILETTPLVMFYPGKFDGTSLRLFDRIDAATQRPGARSYYRAFSLVP